MMQMLQMGCTNLLNLRHQRENNFNSKKLGIIIYQRSIMYRIISGKWKAKKIAAPIRQLDKGR